MSMREGNRSRLQGSAQPLEATSLIEKRNIGVHRGDRKER
jgi:hypothetical protein